MIREPAKPVPPWVLLTSRTFTQDRFENIVPANIVKTKKTFFLTVILTDTHCRATTHVALSPVCAQTQPVGARGHRTHADLPCLYMQARGGMPDVQHGVLDRTATHGGCLEKAGALH